MWVRCQFPSRINIRESSPYAVHGLGDGITETAVKRGLQDSIMSPMFKVLAA